MPRYTEGTGDARIANSIHAGEESAARPLLVDNVRPSTRSSPDGRGVRIDVEEEDAVGPTPPFSNLGTAGIPSSIINIANTILGSGILAMPHAVSSIGLIPGFLMILFSALCSGLGLYFLSRCAARTPGRTASFNSCARLTFPNAAIFFDAAIAVKCFGVGVSYLIIIGDLMPEIVRSFGPAAAGGGWDFWLPWLLSRRFWITVFMAGIVPLAYLPTLDALKYTSSVALMSVAYLWCIVVFHYLDPDTASPPVDEVHYAHASWSFFNNLPIFVFAFTCHQNIFTVYNELRDNSSATMNKVIVGAIGISWFIYETVGMLGYLSFGDSVGVNVLAMYNKSAAVTIGRLSFVFLVLFSYPLQCNPCRFSLDKVLFAISAKLPSKYALLTTTTETDEIEESNERYSSRDAIGSLRRQEESAGHPTTSDSNSNNRDATADNIIPIPTPLRHGLLTTAIVTLSYTTAMLVSSLDVVLSFVGATGSTTISFILPGLFYWKLHQRESFAQRPSKLVAVVLAAYGVCVMVVCLGFNFGKAGGGH